jgi:hypothetical protein
MSTPCSKTIDPETIAGYKVHPAALLLPDPSPADYERLKADIKAHGLRELIALTPDDQILDGRSRARACAELGIEVITESRIEHGVSKMRTAEYLDEDDQVAYVLSMNAARRHLTGDQIIAVYLQANAPKLEAEKLAAKAIQQANLKKGVAQPETESTTVKPSGKTAEKIAKAVGKSKSAVERMLKVQQDAPEKMADVAAGRTSATKVLQESKPKPTEGLEAVEVAGSYLGELVKLSSSIISQIKETVKSKHGVSTKDHEAAVQAVEKLREALATIAPVWKCEECSYVLEPGREPDSRYECGECGDDTLKENRCGSCNKFAAKVSDTACEMEGCSGEMVLVGWETAIDLIAAQKKKEADEERRSSTEWAAAKEFAKTKAGKAEAAKRAAEDKAYEVARLKKDEDHTLELARLIAKGRSEGKTTEQVKRQEEKATRKRRVAENKARWAAEAAEVAEAEAGTEP